MSLSVIELDLPPSWVEQEVSWSLGGNDVAGILLSFPGKILPRSKPEDGLPSPALKRGSWGDCHPCYKKHRSFWPSQGRGIKCVLLVEPRACRMDRMCFQSASLWSSPAAGGLLSKVQALALPDQPWDAGAKFNIQHWICPTEFFYQHVFVKINWRVSWAC